MFYKQWGEVSWSPSLVMEDFNLPDACWKYSPAVKNQSRRFLACVEARPAPAGEETPGKAPAGAAAHPQRRAWGSREGWRPPWPQ